MGVGVFFKQNVANRLVIQYRTSQAAKTPWKFEFIRECMKINKIHPKFQFWTKIEIKMTYLVLVFCYLLSLRL